MALGWYGAFLQNAEVGAVGCPERCSGLPGVAGSAGDRQQTGCAKGKRCAVKSARRVVWEGWSAQSCHLVVDSALVAVCVSSLGYAGLW